MNKISLSEFKQVSEISDVLHEEVGIEFFSKGGENVIEIRFGLDSFISYPNLDGQSIGDIFFHTHNLATGDSAQKRKEAILPENDIDVSLTKTYEEALKRGGFIKNPNGINVITSDGITFFVGLRNTRFDSDFSDWLVRDMNGRSLRFSFRDDESWLNSEFALDIPLLFKRRSGDWRMEMFFIFLPWEYLLLCEEVAGISLYDIIYGNGISKLQSKIGYKQPFFNNLYHAVIAINTVVSKRGSSVSNK